tara:strand:+ start:470 stop:2041 length:1572 start_codon:yes stop_codon:yes gene_type:complete
MKKVREILNSNAQIHRRGFIKGSVSIGVAAAVVPVVSTVTANAATPKKGGHLRQALRGGSVSDTLETGAASGDTHPQNIKRQLYNNLTEQMPNGSVAGELAESWEATPDAATWEFKLRKGVEFHNGKSLEAQDVVESIQKHLGKDTKSVAKGLVSGVKEVKANGKHSVIFSLESGDADLPFTLTDHNFAITPAGISERIGTGPFVLNKWEPGVSAETERNPNYFKEGLPYFDSVETLNVPDATARQNALRTKTVDVIDDPILNTLDLFAKSGGINIQETPGNKHFTIPMRMNVSPFDNNDVRLALKYAIDRGQILKTILNGHGYIGNDHPISRAMRYYADDIPQRSYDIDKAKYHLKKSGNSSLDIELHAGDIFPGGVDTALLFKNHAEKAGINIKINQVSTDGYWSKIWNTVPMCVSYWAGRPTANSMFSLAFSAKSTYNETAWNNERFEELLVGARAELNDEKRKGMYAEMQRLVNEEGGLIAPVFANFVSATSDRIGMAEKQASSWVLDGCKNTERWWFA